VNGKQVLVDTAVTERVLDVKNKLAQLVGLAANKQKLVSVNGAFMKDADTLAYYNIHAGTTITMQVKERGGRK
jgi:splicing factor 3A subunit 1